MADEIPPAPSETDDASKAETIRITLPPKQDQQALKRETVRINLPGKSAGPEAAKHDETAKMEVGARTLPPLGFAPKKESTRLAGVASAPLKPFIAPKPPSMPSVPPPPSMVPAKPIAGVPPRPGVPMTPRATVPLKPGVGAPGTPGPIGSAVPTRGASPKKETARITPIAEAPLKGAASPRPPVKIQQTQPLINRSAPSFAPSPTMTPAAIVPVPVSSSKGETAMCIAAAILSMVSFGLVWLAYGASNL